MSILTTIYFFFIALCSFLSFEVSEIQWGDAGGVF